MMAPLETTQVWTIQGCMPMQTLLAVTHAAKVSLTVVALTAMAAESVPYSDSKRMQTADLFNYALQRNFALFQ